MLFGLVALWTIGESVDAAYGERVTLARALATRVDDVVRHGQAALEREAAELGGEAANAPTEAQQQHLVDLQSQFGGFGTVWLLDAAGTTVWTTAASESADVNADRAGVALALRTGRTAIVEFAGANDKTYASVAVPVRGRDGRAIGALMADLNPDHPALHLLPSGDIENGTYAQLMSTSGRLVAGTRDLSPRVIAEHRTLLAGLMDTQKAGYRIHEPPPSSAFPSHVVAYAPLSILPNWGVVVEQPVDAVLAMPRRLQLRLTLFGLGALVLAAVVAWFDARRVVRPLRRLTAAAERFAGGRLDQSVHLDRSDELGILARAFETMRQRLRASLAEVAEWNRELEHRVDERTAEVEHRNRELAQLYQSLRERERERSELLQRVMDGQEEERRRLAQELHDDTSQALASLRLGLEGLAADGAEPEEVRRTATKLQGLAAQTLAEVHRLAVELRPSVLDDVGLVAALERYTAECGQRWNLQTDFQTVGVAGFRLISAAETAVYRTVQAALTNVAQHAGAQNVSVLLQRRDERLVVLVEDDGKGFDVDSVRAAPLEKRLGLAGMQERAALIGATLTIETQPGIGTTVFLEIPLEANLRREESDVEAAHSAR
ncbi:MAG: HAMP domain-containing protein [Chloroflexota bacterium]|nr:MAG: HAMP domain-containing protein [Chloroflexota bacterium]